MSNTRRNAELEAKNRLNKARHRIENADYRDFMTSLPTASVDLILTDPPYNISKKTGFASVVNGEKRFAVSMDFGPWDQTEVNLEDMAKVFYETLRRGGTAIVWCDIWKIGKLKEAMESVGFKMIRQIIWQKTNPVPLNMRATYLSNSREMAIAAVKVGKPTFNSKYDSGIYEYPIPRHNGNRLHPTQKPLSLFEALVLKHSNQKDLVVDPFLGSGTTGIAAVRNFRRFAGCDLDKKYVQIARERINNN